MTWSLLLVAVVAVATPGADTAAVLRTSTRSRSQGLAAVAGIAVGQAIHTAAAILGLAAVLRTSTAAFEIVRLLGATYLLLLGIASLHHAWRATRDTTEDDRSLRRKHTGRTAFRTGLLANLFNPKTTLFFASLLPQFLTDNDKAAALLAAATMVITISAAWYTLLALASSKTTQRIQQIRVRRRLEAAFGVGFTALSVRLLTISRPS